MDPSANILQSEQKVDDVELMDKRFPTMAAGRTHRSAWPEGAVRSYRTVHTILHLRNHVHLYIKFSAHDSWGMNK